MRFQDAREAVLATCIDLADRGYLAGTGGNVALRVDDEHLAEQRLPSRFDLDRAVPDRPAVIYRYCGHVAVANSMALEASGIDVETPEPEGGIIHVAAPSTPLSLAGSVISELRVAEGDLVEKDQVLAVTDAEPALRAAVEEARTERVLAERAADLLKI